MKLTLFIAAIFSPFLDQAFAGEPDRDETIWRLAYHGNCSLVHKMVLGRLSNDLGDQLLSHFMLLYVFYRSENYPQIEVMLRGIDVILEKKLHIENE